MTSDLFESIANGIELKQSDISQLSPLVLAYIGDSVFEVFIRTLVISKGNAPVHVLHKRAVDFVKAKAQSDGIHRILDSLTAQEQDIVRRGRNAKSGTIPKNADVTEYKYATGFESLIGYLYLMKEHSRLIEVLKMSISEK
jgi:ribonuclease III family protein